MKEQIKEMAKIAEEAIDNHTAHNCPSLPCPYRESSICCDVCLTLEALHNAGYRKQSEGMWEIVKGSNGKEKMVCTNCRHQQDLASTFTFCPNCGAKMKGGE